MASIRAKGDGYQVTWSTLIGGKRQQYGRSFATRTEAIRYADRVAREYEAHGSAPDEELALPELIARYLDHCGPRVQRTTLHGYRRNLDYLSRQLGPMRVRRISARHLDDAYAALAKSGGHEGNALSPRTVRHVHRVAHAMFKQAKRWKLVDANPAADASPIAVPFTRAKAYSPDQVAAAVAVAGASPWPEMICLAVSTGLRRSELCGLAWSALDLTGGWLVVSQVCEQAGKYYGLRQVPKTKSSARRIALDPGLCTMLQAWHAKLAERVLAIGLRWHAAALVFPDLRMGDVGAPREPNNVSARFHKIGCKIGLPTGVSALHGLRHRHASSLMALPVRLVADRLGHSTPAITLNLYQHGDDEGARTVADASAVAFGNVVALVGKRNLAPKK
jgi:integrase